MDPPDVASEFFLLARHGSDACIHSVPPREDLARTRTDDYFVLATDLCISAASLLTPTILRIGWISHLSLITGRVDVATAYELQSVHWPCPRFPDTTVR